MSSFRRPSITTAIYCGLGIAVAALTPPAACGAQTAPAQTPAPPTLPTLDVLLPRVRWNVTQQGVLLIVTPQATRAVPSGNDTAASLPERDAYTLADLADPFNRQIVHCGGVQVFTPATMTILNDKSLPPPSPYLEATPQDAFRALLASLRPDQWAQMKSDGLAVTNFSAQQQQLWAIVLPPIVGVQRAIPYPPPSPMPTEEPAPVLLSQAQRQQIRLHVTQSAAAMATYKVKNQSSSGAITANWPPYAPDPLRLWVPPRQSAGTQNRVSAQMLRQSVPAFAKPGDLPFDWQALDPAVDLSEATTVGNLIAAIVHVTRVELHCDIRYTALKLYTRGKTARAGDLLKALCRGVNGTWRKVGSAYVLTDDRVGLGARHATIVQWLQACDTLRRNQEQQITDTLSAPGILTDLPFDASLSADTNDTLKQKIREAEQNPNAREPPFPFRRRTVKILVEDLPPEARDAVQEIIRQRDREPGTTNGQGDVYLWDKTVDMNLTPQLWLDLPGIGLVAAPGSLADRDGNFPLPIRLRPVPPAPRPYTLPAVAVRAFLIQSDTLEKTTALMERARASGFNELWISCDDAEPATLTQLREIIAEGKKRHLPVRAVVRAWRTTRAAPDLPRDLNVRGETWRQAAASQARQPALRFNVARSAVEGAGETARRGWLRQNALGDFLVMDDAAVQAARAHEIATVAQTPGLAGLVVQDLTPPGYDYFLLAMGRYGSGQRTGGDLGYSDTQRLAFLRETHVDPVDISLSGDTPLVHWTNDRTQAPVNLSLPGFPSLPLNVRGIGRTSLPGVFTTKEGDDRLPFADLPNGDLYENWIRRRAEAQSKAQQALLKQIKDVAGPTPILISNALDIPGADEEGKVLYFHSVDTPSTPVPPRLTLEPQPRPKTPEAERQAVHRLSRQTFIGARWEAPADDPAWVWDVFAWDALKQARLWGDGYVADLSHLPSDLALIRLKQFMAPTQTQPKEIRKE